jgi:acetoin utilization protein AcuB
MIVRDIMTTRLITVAPEDTLGHVCNLFRRYQFHHLPVVQTRVVADRSHHDDHVRRTIRLFEGVLTTQDIELAMAHAQHNSSSQLMQHPWQEQRVAEVMNPSPLCVSPTTSVGAAARLLVERGLSGLPVIEYSEEKEQALTLLVGLLTRSDLLLTLAHTYGAFEPGMPLDIVLPDGDMAPLTTVLRLAAELHVRVRSVVVAPSPDGIPPRATLSLGTIYPMPLLSRLQEAGITYQSAHPLEEEQKSPTQQEVG